VARKLGELVELGESAKTALVEKQADPQVLMIP
jgi:hypothetical protein